jgi:hypothetical protein
LAITNINKRATACNYTIDELVRNIAPQIEVIKTAFADAKFGDVEPVNGATLGKMDDNLQFAKEFFRQTGVRLSRNGSIAVAPTDRRLRPRHRGRATDAR